MHISNAQIQKVFELHLHKVHAFLGPWLESPAGRPDQLTLSKQAAEMQNIKQFLSGLPDVRQDKVREFQSMVEKETYEASDYDVALAMLESTAR